MQLPSLKRLVARKERRQLSFRILDAPDSGDQEASKDARGEKGEASKPYVL